MEVTGLDAAAERALWEWLAGMDLIRTIAAWRQPVPPPLFLQLQDPRRLGLTVGRRPVGSAGRPAGGPRGALVRGPWIGDIRGHRCVHARERGPLDPAACRATGERPRWCGRPPAPSPISALDTTDLATVYLGAFTFADLARAGRLEECRDGAVAGADRLFATTVGAVVVDDVLIDDYLRLRDTMRP